MEIKTEVINGKRYVCIDDLEKLFNDQVLILGCFNKIEFSNILFKISKNYISQREFARLSGVNRNYISQYINTQLLEPPGPKILRKIAIASKGITTYKELMQVCGYLDGIEE